MLEVFKKMFQDSGELCNNAGRQKLVISGMGAPECPLQHVPWWSRATHAQCSGGVGPSANGAAFVQ